MKTRVMILIMLLYSIASAATLNLEKLDYAEVKSQTIDTSKGTGVIITDCKRVYVGYNKFSGQNGVHLAINVSNDCEEIIIEGNEFYDSLEDMVHITVYGHIKKLVVRSNLFEKWINTGSKHVDALQIYVSGGSVDEIIFENNYAVDSNIQFGNLKAAKITAQHNCILSGKIWISTSEGIFKHNTFLDGLRVQGGGKFTFTNNIIKYGYFDAESVKNVVAQGNQIYYDFGSRKIDSGVDKKTIESLPVCDPLTTPEPPIEPEPEPEEPAEPNTITITLIEYEQLQAAQAKLQRITEIIRGDSQ